MSTNINNNMAKRVYISFITENDKPLLNLHTQAIRRFDKDSDIIYFSMKPIEVPKGTINIEKIGIGTRTGFNNLKTFLTVLNTLKKQYDTIIFSNPSTLILGDEFIKYVDNKEILSWYCFENNSLSPLTSCFVLSSLVIDPLTDILSSYWDSFDCRNCLEVVLGYLTLISHPQQIAAVLPIHKNGLNTHYAIFTSDLYNNPDKFKYVASFVECGHMSYLNPYAESHLDLFLQIKRAMRFILHFLRVNNKE